MTPKERGLLTGMGNCYAACRASLEETLEMVGGSRGVSCEEVKAMLIEIRERHGKDDEYRRLRSMFPDSFPVWAGESRMLTKCPCREANLKPHDFRDPGEHFYAKCLKSDSGHVMWLNRNITKTKTDPRTLAKSLERSIALMEM